MKDNAAGEWKWTSGKWFADEADKGIQTSPDNKFHSLWAELKKPFTNDKKDLVLQVRGCVLARALLLRLSVIAGDRCCPGRRIASLELLCTYSADQGQQSQPFLAMGPLPRTIFLDCVI